MRTYFLAFFCFFLLVAKAQIALPDLGGQTVAEPKHKVKQHASWTVEVVPAEVAIGKEAELVIKADIEEGWYLYSSDFDPNLGPIVTSLKFNPSSDYSPVGKLMAVHPKREFDDIWGGEISKFIGKGEFRQKIKILKENPSVSGTIEYQTCTIKDGACVSGEYDLAIQVKTARKKPEEGGKIVPNGDSMATRKASLNSSVEHLSVPKKDTDGIASVENKVPTQLNTTKAEKAPLNPTKKGALWMFFLQAFLFGLAGLVTPCVFPMIPMTVSFFTKSSKSHAEAINKGLFYGGSIVFIYTVVGTLVALFFGADAANFISTHWLPNLFFFAVFVLFASSFLGLFEITLPHWLVNKADQQSDQGGWIGIFFMASTIVLVSFSCTGPLVGTILIESAGGKFLKPIVGMLGFSAGFAIPFTLFALFPSWLKALPKSGGWLNTVKVFLGFLELALAFKFLSQADQVYHWRILDREVFLAIWIVIFTLLGAYLVRKIKLSHDDEDYMQQPVGVPRLLVAICSFSFVVYLIPGMFGAPLKLLSGYLPPLSTSDFVLNSEATSHAITPAAHVLCDTPKYAELFHLPHGLQGYFDLKQAQACAKQQQKPLFIDFTGHGCANCREMEANVWSDPEVLKRLQEDFVIVSLYVDERQELPKEEWYTSPYDHKEKTTIGKQNADLEIRLFQNNAQPLYVIADAELKTWLEPRAFNRDVKAFVDFLEEGKMKF